MPGPLVPTSDDKVLKKYTLQPRSAQILELLGAQILGAVDENDLRNIASPAVCKKYVLLLADKLNDEMLKTQLYVSDKTIPIEGHEVVLYKYSESQQSLCNSFAFYVARILQLIFLCMCHISTNPAPSFDDSGVPSIGPVAAVSDTTKIRDVRELEKFITEKNKKLANVSDIADIFYSILDKEQTGAVPNDPRVFFSNTGDYKYWYDPVQNKLGFTKDNKNYYMDFKVLYSANEKQPSGKTDKAILFFKDGDAGTKTYRWFANDLFAEPVSKKDGDKTTGSTIFIQTYREIVFSSAAERVLKTHGDGDDSEKLFGKKSESAASTGTLAPGTVVFSNPLYAIQHAMLVSSYVEGGFVYDVGNIAEVEGKLRAWIGAFMDIAFGDIYEKITSKDGKMYTIEKNKVKWQVVQRPAADERAFQAQKVRAELGSLFSQLKVLPPKVSRETLMHGIQTGSRGWNSYYYYYKEFTAMQTKMAEFATAMLFSGAAGLPPLVLWQSTERGRVFKVNPELMNIGAKKIEVAFAEMRKAMYNLYGKTLLGVIKINEAMQLMNDEVPRTGGSKLRKIRKTQKISKKHRKTLKRRN